MYKKVCVAGTFDHIHAGHEALLRKAFDVGSHVLIGLTSDEFVVTYKKTSVRSSATRKKNVIDWLDVHGYNGRYDLVLIDDPYEPALSSESLEALVVSEESKKRAEELNRKRVEKGLQPLTLLLMPLQIAEDEKPISSTRIREREIDTKGNLVLPRSLRDQLTKPIGKLLETATEITTSFATHNDDIVILVGDATTKTALDAGLKPSLVVFDNKVERKTFTGLSMYSAILKKHRQQIVSGPAFIAKSAIDAIATWGASARPHQCVVVEIDGEEDLLTLPVVAHAPIGSIVYYGQPHKGIVEVVVTTEKKKEVQKLLSKFLSS